MLRIDSLIQIFWTKACLFIAIIFTWCLLKFYFFLVYLMIWVFVFVGVVREAKNEPRGGGRGGGRGYGRGGGGGGGGVYNCDFANNEGSFPDSGDFGRSSEPHEPYSGGGGGGGGVYNCNFANNEGSFPDSGDSGRSSERHGYGGPHEPYSGGGGGGRRGGFSNGEAGDMERPRRVFERHNETRCR